MTEVAPDRDAQTGRSTARRTNRTRWWTVGVAGILVVVGVALAVQIGTSPSLRSGKLLGEPVPAFAGTDLTGERRSSAEFAGRATLVNFWNEWCLPCRQETPALVEFWERHREDPDFAMVGIVRDMRSESALVDYAADNGMDWPIIFDPDGRAAVDFATTGQPESFFVAPDGTVVRFHAGAADLDDLEGMLAVARGEAAS